MDDLVVQFDWNARRRSPSERFTNSVLIFLDKIHENPITGHRTLTGSNLFDFNLHSSSHRHIHQLLHNRLVNFPWLCEYLASHISFAATNIGFGLNGFVITVFIKITSSLSKAALMRLVQEGRLDESELKCLNMETEQCSICLENLSGSKPSSVPTRLTCSHVFHDRCLLDWLYRQNTCPLCRTELYHRSFEPKKLGFP